MELTSPDSGRGAHVPEDWTATRIGELGTWLSGGTPSTTNQEYWHGTIPWVSAKDMKTQRLRDAEDYITEKALCNGARLAPEGAVVIVVRGMILAHTFPAARTERTLAFNQDLRALVARDGVDSEYVLHWFQANGRRLLALATESTHGTKRLPSGDLFAVALQLPQKTSEQRLIASALNDAEALIATVDQLIAKKRDIKHGAMQQLLTGKTRLPGFSEDWRQMRIGDVGSFRRGQGIKKDDVVASGLPCIRYGEIYTRHSDYIREFYSFIPREVAKGSTRLRTGDLLFAGSGETAEEIGKCVAFLGSEEAYAGGDILILSPHGHDSMYLGYVMNHPLVASQKARMGQGDAVVHISAVNLAQVELRFPSLQEQCAIASVFADMDAEVAALEARRAKTRLLKQGMMQELLTGRIRLA